MNEESKPHLIFYVLRNRISFRYNERQIISSGAKKNFRIPNNILVLQFAFSEKNYDYDLDNKFGEICCIWKPTERKAADSQPLSVWSYRTNVCISFLSRLPDTRLNIRHKTTGATTGRQS